MQHARSHRSTRTWISTTFVVLSVLGGPTTRSLAQETCETSSGSSFRVTTATEALALGAAVDCTGGGTVKAVWAGGIALPAPISIGSGTFLSITGEGKLAEVRGGYQTRLFDVSPSGGLSLTQLDLSGGSAATGGAIYSRRANITLDGCVFHSNKAIAGDGGAVWAEGGDLTIVGGTFSDNSASGNGGAVLARDATVVIQEGTQFDGNMAAEGGGLYCGGSGARAGASATCSLSEAVFTANNASLETKVEFPSVWTVSEPVDGGGGAAFWFADVTITDSVFASNSAQLSGGGIFGGNSTDIAIERCTFRDNDTPGYGAAVAASSATLGANTFLTRNSAGEHGGGMFGWDPAGAIEFNGAECSENAAEKHGGCLFGAGSSTVNTGTVMKDNVAKTGGCIYAFGGAEINVRGGEFAGCRSTGNGGFMFGSDGAFVTITGGKFTKNVAERRAGVVYCSGDSNDLGGAKVTIKGGTFSDNQALELGGAIVAWGTPTVVTITGGSFSNNTAKFYGGFLFLEEGASLSCEGATITNNYAGDQGGAIYARDATWVNSSCDLIGNVAPQGAAAYLTYVGGANFENHSIIDTSAAGVSMVYAAETSMTATGVRFQSEIDPLADSSNRAVRLEGAATLFAEGCVFRGWIGDTVVHNANPAGRSLVLNGCDFSDCSASTAVLSPYSDAEIRNAVVGAPTIKSASTVNGTLTLVDRALGCDDSRACGAGECLESVLGVLCECLDGGACLDGGGALSISLKTAPDPVTYNPNSVHFELMVSAGSEATTPAIWNLTYDVEDLALQLVPSSGVLPPGEDVTVTVTGTPLQEDIGGHLKSRFVATSVGSSNSDSTTGVELEVESVFYLCQAFEYAVPADGGGVTCKQCITIDGADGVDCDTPGATQASLPLRPGYWRSTKESMTIHNCLHADACAGATQVLTSDDYCAEGYKGPYCAVCTEGYGAGSDQICHPCTGLKSRWLVVAGSVFVVVVALSLMVGVLFLIGGIDAVQGAGQKVRRRSLSWSRGRRKRVTEAPGPSRKSARGEDGADGTVSPVLDGRDWRQASATLTMDAQTNSQAGGSPVISPIPNSSDVAREGAVSREASTRERVPACCDIGGKVKRWASRVPMNKIKIMVVVLQILTIFPNVSGVEYPQAYSRFLSWVDFVNFDIGTIFSASCMMRSLNFYGKLVMMTLLPLGLASLLVVTYWVAMRRAGGKADSILGRAAWSRHMAAGLLLTFLVFTSTSTVVFQTFACDEEAVEGESYLRADYSLSCNSTSHVLYRVYAGIMILIFPLGIPVVYAYILWINRESLNPEIQIDNMPRAEIEQILEKRRENPNLVPSMFLWKDFGGNLYYFEVIDCFRRILLTSALIFVAPNTAAQAAVACMFAFASVLGFELLRPHLDPLDSWLYRLGSVVIFLSNFLALLIKVDAAGESNKNILGGIMVAINIMLIGAVLVATWFATQQTVQDHRDGETVIGVAATMLTFEQRVAASTRLGRQKASGLLSSPGASLSSGASSRSCENVDFIPSGETRENDEESGVDPTGPDAWHHSNGEGLAGILIAVERRGSVHFDAGL